MKSLESNDVYIVGGKEYHVTNKCKNFKSCPYADKCEEHDVPIERSICLKHVYKCDRLIIKVIIGFLAIVAGVFLYFELEALILAMSYLIIDGIKDVLFIISRKKLKEAYINKEEEK